MLEGFRAKGSAWLFASGIIVICLGIYVWMHPAEALMALALYIGVILLIIGASYFVMFLKRKRSWYLALALMNIFVGIILVANLGVSAETLPVMFGFWALFVGIIQLTSSYHYQRRKDKWGWSFISGLLGIIFGFLMLIYPMLGAVTITIVIGTYMILYGALGIAECNHCNMDDDYSM